MDGVRGHALLLPFPAQGHITPLMQLANILISNHIVVTFVNTDFLEKRLNHTFTHYLRFESFPDGLPPDHVRTLKLPELCESLQKHAPFHVHNIVEKIEQSVHVPPLTIIIADGVFSFTQQIADKFGVPRVAFWTTSACGFSAYYYMPLLIHHGYIPLKDDRDRYKNDVITCIPEMEALRVKDLPSFLTVTDAEDYMFQYLLREAQNTHPASLVLLNTFQELEGPLLSDLNSKFGNKVLSIGPLLLSSAGFGDAIAGTNSSIWNEEKSCLEWLEKQKESSVIYVCFGSITVLSDEELVEFAWGLEASNQPFLWAIRPDLVQGSRAVLPDEFVEKTKERSFFVSWAPQSKVLSHPSVGGFLTHSGWNSTLESISSGVPMICWPFFAEQPTNRRFVDDVWKVGYEMRENVVREEVEVLVRKLMNLEDNQGREMRVRLKKYKDKAITSVKEGGASYKNMQEVLKQMQMKTGN
ncbi:7-deoxyloganetin glucosyltransferase [Cryptomeria japonica]|uniref:7-deoxyloganetin glucosyltransferase n=1 Tax=Cryptomeria japonica TaxID=3369 RepID=UPI0027D9E4A2|nr:7-deoxyloganetin glucosyltransferase [Cryptomeria japonica]